MEEARREYIEDRLTELENIIDYLEMAKSYTTDEDIENDFDDLVRKYTNELNKLQEEEDKYRQEEEKYMNLEYERSV